MAFIRRKIDWTAPVNPKGSGLTMEPDQNPYIADVSANTEPDSREWNIRFTQGEDTGNVVDVTVTQPPVYKFTICYYDKNVTEEEELTAEHTSGATIILCADMEGRIRIGQGTVSEDGCCEIFADQKSGYVFACGAREWSEYGNDILVSAGTGDSQPIIGVDNVNFPVDDFDGCETVRSASTSATYEGSISIWATSKTYRNNICGSGVTARDGSFIFYMLVGEGQEECQIVSITPEVGATTDISNFVWNYAITGVDETNDEQLNDYEVIVSPISDTGKTGSFNLLKPYKQALTVESNLPESTTVDFNVNDINLGSSPIKSDSAILSVVGCEDAITDKSYTAKANYTLKQKTEENVYELSVDKNTITFPPSTSSTTVPVTSTTTINYSSYEEWDPTSPGGKTTLTNGNVFRGEIKKIEHDPVTGDPEYVNYEVVIDEEEQEPEENVEVAFYYKTGQNTGKKITEILTVPNSVSSNTEAQVYFYAAYLKNGSKTQISYDNLTYNPPITGQNTSINSSLTIVSCSYGSKSASITLKIEGVGRYRVDARPMLVTNVASAVTINGSWRLSINDSSTEPYEIATKGDGISLGQTGQYALTTKDFYNIPISPDKQTKITLSTTENFRPYITDTSGNLSVKYRITDMIANLYLLEDNDNTESSQESSIDIDNLIKVNRESKYSHTEEEDIVVFSVDDYPTNYHLYLGILIKIDKDKQDDQK